MTPRNLELKTYAEGIYTVQKTHENLKSLRQETISYNGKIPQGVSILPKFSPKENVYEMKVVLPTDISNTFGLNLCVGERRKIIFRYDTESETLLVDRTNCLDVLIDKFPRISFAKLSPEDKKKSDCIFTLINRVLSYSQTKEKKYLHYKLMHQTNKRESKSLH